MKGKIKCPFAVNLIYLLKRDQSVLFQINKGNKPVNNPVFAVGGSWGEMKFISNVHLS